MNLSDLRLQEAIAPAVSCGVADLFWMRRQKQPSRERLSVAALAHGGPAAAFAGAFLGCLATLHLGAFGFVPAIASALATVLLCGPLLATGTATPFCSEFFTAVYGGTFAGMTSVLWLTGHAPLHSIVLVSALFILLSSMCGLVFCLVAEIDTRAGRRVAGGYGGRSGAIAAVASFVFVELASLFGVDDARFRASRADMLDLDPGLAVLSCAACLLGMYATLLVLRRQSVATAETADRTLLASAVALVGLIALHQNDPNDTCTADAFYAGCFLGMSTRERLKGWIQPLLGAVLLTVILIQARTLLPGVGGSLGLAAFVTVALLVALSRIINGILGDDGSLEVPTQGSASGRSLQPSGRASANPMFGLGYARAVALAGAITGLLAVGWLVLPDQLASQEDAAAPTRLTEQSAQIPAPLTSDRATTRTDEGAGLAGQFSAKLINADHAAATTGYPDTNPQRVAGIGETTDITANRRADRTAELSPTASAVQSATADVVDGVAESHEDMFREFMRWDAAHPRAPAAPQPAKRNRVPLWHLVRITPAGSPPQPPAGRRPDRPNSASGLQSATVTAGLPKDPAGSVRNPGIRMRPASGQSIP